MSDADERILGVFLEQLRVMYASSSRKDQIRRGCLIFLGYSISAQSVKPRNSHVLWATVAHHAQQCCDTEQTYRCKLLEGSTRKLLARQTVTPVLYECSEDRLARRSLEFSSVVTREGRWYVAECPELEIASQGKTVELALKNLREAIELYLQDEDAKAPEVDYRPIVTVVKVVRA